MKKVEDNLQNAKFAVNDGIKKYVYDIIAIVILLSLIAASLDLFGLIDFKTVNIVSFLIGWFPYFAAAMLLRTDLYKKGVFIGKKTDKFCAVARTYSELANSLSGEQLKGLYPFCEEYNSNAKQAIQTQILKAEGLTYEEYNEDWIETVDGVDVQRSALKTCTKQELLERKYTKTQIRAIKKAKRAKVYGISVNILLSTIAVKDVTYIGNDEKSLQIKQIAASAIKYILCTVALSFIAIKDTISFGWLSVILILFKVTYLFAGSCISYFRGYDDITIHLVNHFTRKTDILKMYLNVAPADDTNSNILRDN